MTKTPFSDINKRRRLIDNLEDICESFEGSALKALTNGNRQGFVPVHMDYFELKEVLINPNLLITVVSKKSRCHDSLEAAAASCNNNCPGYIVLDLYKRDIVNLVDKSGKSIIPVTEGLNVQEMIPRKIDRTEQALKENMGKYAVISNPSMTTPFTICDIHETSDDASTSAMSHYRDHHAGSYSYRLIDEQLVAEYSAGQKGIFSGRYR